MKKAIFAVLLLLASTAPAGAQQVDSCLCIWGAADSNLWINPDTVMVDTCKSHMGFPPSSNEYVYSKRYEITFKYALIKLNAVSPDSVLIVPWTSIDTTYIEFRNTCKNVASRYDGLWFIKDHPAIGDSTNPRYHDFSVIIGEYAQVDSIYDSLADVAVTDAFGFYWPGTGIVNVKPTPKPEPFKLIFLDATHVLLNGIISRTNYAIVNTLGETELQSSLDPDESIDLGLLPHGFYILRFEGDQTFKIVR